ncbi:MAG TPA: ATP-binding protein [Steroidobacteraceae bacterium]
MTAPDVPIALHPTTQRAHPWLLQYASLVAGLLVALGAGFIAFEWLAEGARFLEAYPDLAQTHPNGAFALTAAGIGLVGAALSTPQHWFRPIVAVAATVTIVIAALSLAAYMVPGSTTFDPLLVGEARIYSGGLRIGVNTAFALLCLGIALALADRPGPSLAIAQTATGAALLIVLLAFIGYAYDIEQLSQWSPSAGMAPPTATAILLLSVGLLTCEPSRGLVRPLLRAGAAGYMMRRLLPTAFVTLLALGGVTIAAARSGYASLEIAIAGFALGSTLIVAALVYWIAGSLARLEARREAAERELSETAARLRESEERFRNMADHAPGMVWLTAPDGRCSFLSQSWYALTGQTPEVALGEGWLNAVHPEEREVTRGILFAANAKRMPFRFDLRVCDRDGQYHWAIIAATPRFGEKRSFLGYVGSIIDITDRKLMEEELREADQRKDEFLAMLGHELRNPLAPIRSAAAVIGLLHIDDPKLVWAREVIERQVAHMTRLIDDLLDVARITRGTVLLKTGPVELARIVGEAIEASRPLIDDRHHTLEVELPQEPVWLQADAARLGQVLVNLLNNAAKYMEEGGRIVLRAVLQGGEVEISVKDTGVGIDPELLPRIFDLFTQDKRSIDRAQGGLGIGLTLVKALVEMHGGSVKARSAGRGRGAEFIVRLPRGAALAPQDAKAPEPRASPADAHAQRVLIVDDNVDSAQALAALLALEGHMVATANSGPQALEQAPGFAPGVVLLDIGLPGMDGHEVARRLRAMPQTRNALLIAVTGYGGEGDRRRSAEAGFAHHLVKPVDAPTLAKLLATAARGRGG